MPVRWLLCTLIVVHGLLHLLGAAKGYRLAALPQLTQQVSTGAAVAWLAAAVLMLAAAVTLMLAPHCWWIVGAIAVSISQGVILTAWLDARFGTIANLVILLAVLHGFAAEGPRSLRAAYRRDVAARLTQISEPVLTSADVVQLPSPIRRYLEYSGAIGAPRVHHFSALWRGRIRGAESEPWMTFTAKQVNNVVEPSRHFLMKARRGGLPVDVLHAFVSGTASMRVRLLSLVTMASGEGPDLTRAETVTLLNDLCVLAPGALVDRRLVWEAIDEESARVQYTIGANTVSATLTVNATGELVDFVSDDRLVASSDGKSFTSRRWSTPLSDYRQYGVFRLASRGAGVWHAIDGRYLYIEMELLEVQVNGAK